MELACQPLRDQALTRCPDSLTTTQPRGGRCAPVPVPAHWLLTSTSSASYAVVAPPSRASSVCAVAP